MRSAGTPISAPRQEKAPEPVQPREPASAEKRREQRDDAELRDLARLEEPKPPLAAIDLLADEQDGDEADERKRIGRDGQEVEILAIVEGGEGKVENKPEERRREVAPPDIMEKGRRARMTRRVDRHRADGDEREHRGEEQSVEATQEFHDDAPPSVSSAKKRFSTAAPFGAVVPPPDSPFSTTIATAMRGASDGA